MIKGSYIFQTGFKVFLLLIFLGTTNAASQHYDNSGYHHDNSHRKASDSDMPSVCEHLQVLVKHHENEQAHELIIETLKENPTQPDCFFHSARLYFNHKLSGRDRHSKYLFDSLMTLYDKWFAASRHPIEVLNYKGRDVRDYYYKEPDSLRKYCALYKRIYDADRENLHPYNLKMMAFCACDLYGKVNIDSLFYFTKKQSSSHHEHLWKAPFKSLKRELIKCPKLDCSHVNFLLHPEILSGKDGFEENQKVARLIKNRGCPLPAGYDLKATGSPEPASDPEIKKESSVIPVPVSVYMNLMKVAEGNKSKKMFKEALENYSLALNNTTVPMEKADAYLGMAAAADSLKDFIKAKEYGIAAHGLLPDETEGIRFLSRLYQKGEHECEFHTAREQAAYYILLSKLAWSLSNSEESDAWKENANLNELYKSGQAKKGDKIHLGCFINEEVELP